MSSTRSENLAEQQRRALTWGEVLQGSDKRQSDALPECRELERAGVGRQDPRLRDRLEPVRPLARFEIILN